MIMKFSKIDFKTLPKKRKCVKVNRKVINILDHKGNIIGEMVSYERIMENLD